MYLIFLLKKYLNNKAAELIISQNLNYGFIGLVDNKKKADRKTETKQKQNRTKTEPKQNQNRTKTEKKQKQCLQ